MQKNNLEEALNASQREAVLFRKGTLLVIAGAGSGKTRTLTYRVAGLVNDGVEARRILLLTFTRKAAQEMVNRAAELLDSRCEKVSGGTFHSFANMILRKYASEIGFENSFTIIDRADSEDLVGIIRKELGFSSKSRKFPTKKTVMNIFSRSVNKVMSIEDVVYNEYGHFSSDLEDILKVNREYIKRKRLHGFLDYDDLLVYLRDLLHDKPEIRERISSSYDYIMVDEYQDTNKIQAEILYQLASVNKNVMVVGDDSQSIYAFRGANFRNIIDFPNIFPGAKIIRLEENYRSVQPILTLTNTIIEQAEEKYSKRLFTQKKSGALPVLVCTGDETAQSLFVIKKIQEIQKTGADLDDIAVLFRAGFHSFNLEVELNRQGVLFNKVGGFKFVESAHIKDFVAHMRVLSNSSDRLSWHRVLSLVENIGPKKGQVIFETISKSKSSHEELYLHKFPEKVRKNLEALQQLYRTIDISRQSVFELGEAILNYYLPILKAKFDDHPKRLKDLEQLLVMTERYENLDTFLSDMALEPPNTSSDDIMEIVPEANGRLTLSTIHSAKGLEWDSVFILWALDGRFPSMQSIDNDDALEEERRLMYVAATRAKENLYFLYPKEFYDRNARMVFSHPSRFLSDMPDAVMEKQFFQTRHYTSYY